MGKIAAFVEQWNIECFREGIGRAVGEVQPRFRIDAFAVAGKCSESLTRLLFIERDNLKIILNLQKVPHSIGCDRPIASIYDNPRFMDIDR